MRSSVFTIGPGVPFLKTFVGALLDGKIVPGFSRALSPLPMADATIYVPTQRAARSLAQEFANALIGDRSACLLPRILPLGALDTTETALFFEEAGIETPLAEDLPQAASEIWRRMHLARLIFRWAQSLKHAIVSVDGAGRRRTDPREDCLVGTSPLDAFALAGHLADLIDELIIEDIDFAALDPLVLPEFDQYWRITLDFLQIAIAHWPQILAENGLVDAAARRKALVEGQIARLREGAMPGPVIAVGSTGSNRATAHLLAAIAAAPQGAVVLPGLDLMLDDEAWSKIGKASEMLDPAFGHPQAALAKLVMMLKTARVDVVELGTPAPQMADRMRFVSEALRPAETTEHWQAYRHATPDRDIAAALAGVALIEAGDEREEALALAIALREALETPGKTAALVTPDRTLARRVATELARFGLDIEDSAGEPLSASPAGVVARLILLCAESGLAGEDAATLLLHPLTQLGLSREKIQRLAPLFEIGVLRQDRAFSHFTDAKAAIASARRKARERFAHPAQSAIEDADWDALEELSAHLFDALAPFSELKGPQILHRFVEAHRASLARVMAGADPLVPGEDYCALQALFDELLRCAPSELAFSVESYLPFFAEAAAAIALHPQKRTHPRLKIFGLLEARLMEADLMLLGGLDETIWPPETKSDAFLNRPMRAALGLSPPERKIGQTAHDFVSALGAKQVILSRAQKRDGKPMIASRFVQRLAAVGGEGFAPARQRGTRYLALARALDRPQQAVAPLKRPLPRPPVASRPRGLSVTRIETLRRDPYAIYAEFILKLIPLPPPAQAMSPRIMGTAIHDVLARFCAEHSRGALPADAEGELRQMLRQAFAEDLTDPEFSAFAWPRIEGLARFYLDFEHRRRGDLAALDIETEGRLSILLADDSTFTLSAKADRLEHRSDGKVNLLDYKTGTPPGMDEVRVGFAPQLTLEAAMAQRGAFGLAEGTAVAEALYVKLGGRSGGEERVLNFASKRRGEKDAPAPTLGEVADAHFHALLGLLNQFRDEATAYPPRPFPKFAAKYNAYDHLARVKEWASGLDDGGGA